MKTPAQWLEQILMVEDVDESADYNVVINVRDIAAIQRDAIAHEPLSPAEKNAPCTKAEWRFAKDMVGTEPERHWGCVLALREYIATLPKQPEYGRYTEATLAEAGWYWFCPKQPKPRHFILLTKPMINRLDFPSRKSRAGTYIGPVAVPPP